MKKFKHLSSFLPRFLIVILLIAIFLAPSNVLAQSYYFSLDKEIVHVFWNDDGSLSLDYELHFSNSSDGHAIEYVDVGLPHWDFTKEDISADVDGDIVGVSSSDYMGGGDGVAIVLGSYAIAPGEQGVVHVFVPAIKNILQFDAETDDYASAVFSPVWFASEYVYGSTDLTVVFHLPPGVQPEEPRWHLAPDGFPEFPVADVDDSGRITYTWNNPEANGYTQYIFGASFPAQYVPDSALPEPTATASPVIALEDTPTSVTSKRSVWDFALDSLRNSYYSFYYFVRFRWQGIVLAIFIVTGIWKYQKSKNSKKQYIPPKMKIEGHGIKRGLTAIEAAILLERPADKILTMVLFSTLKKGAAKIISRDPLKLEIIKPVPKDLRAYESKFLRAFKTTSTKAREETLQNLIIDITASVSKKMQGFSYKESVVYYKSIIKKAWMQVENAQTPEIRSKEYTDHLDWTILDDDFEEHTKEVFISYSVYLPDWWERYDPGFEDQIESISPKVRNAQVAASAKVVATSVAATNGIAGAPKTSSVGKSSQSLPVVLPGGEFAASLVTGIQGFSTGVVRNLTEFTSDIIAKTNPTPKVSKSSSNWKSSSSSTPRSTSWKSSSSSSSSSRSSSCACACACAGCACACAGGGR